MSQGWCKLGLQPREGVHMNKVTARNICKLYRESTAAQRESGVRWYADAATISAALADKYDITWEQAAGVIAALSPLRSWGDNVNLAARAIANGGLTGGAFKDSVAKVNRILAGEKVLDVLGGDKVRAFFQCILTGGQTSAVCIDRHALDAATNTRNTDETRPRLSGKRYREIADAYVRAARILSRESGQQLTPSAVQATVWLAWRSRFWAEGAFDSYDIG